MSIFEGFGNTGFHMVFDNGYSISVQWNIGNYCSNRHADPLSDVARSRTAEVQVTNVNTGKPVPINETTLELNLSPDAKEDTVAGWLRTDSVLKVMNNVMKLSGFYDPTDKESADAL